MLTLKDTLKGFIKRIVFYYFTVYLPFTKIQAWYNNLLSHPYVMKSKYTHRKTQDMLRKMKALAMPVSPKAVFKLHRQNPLL